MTVKTFPAKNKLIAVLILTTALTALSSLCLADGGESFLNAPDNVALGQPFFAQIDLPAGVKSAVVSWLGKEATLSLVESDDRSTCRFLLGTDLKNTKPGDFVLAVKYEEDSRTSVVEKNIQVTPKSYPAENLTVPPKMVSPSPEMMKKIIREAKLGSNAINTNTRGSAPEISLVRPVPGIIVSVYGKSRYFNNVFKGRHCGLDFRAPPGTPVRAVADGRVVLAADFWFAGKCVYIDHGAGIISFYGHMSKIGTKTGAVVKAGDILGLSGKTGRVTGPHLHLSMSWRGEFFDPAPLFEK